MGNLNQGDLQPLHIEPYSLAPVQCRGYFGIKATRIYDLVNSGQLRRGVHYYKVGRSILIIVSEFQKWLKEKNDIC